MRKKTQTITITVIIAAFLGSVPFFNLYYIRDDSGGQLLWKANEAYLFVAVAHRGYRFRVLEYPSIIFKEWLNAPPFPNDQSFLFTVIRVTPSGIERHVGKVTDIAERPDFFTPIGEAIFANRKGTLCKLVGDRFERATPEEEHRLDGISNLASDIDISINGWSKRGIGAVSGAAQFSIEIGKGTALRVQQGNFYGSDDGAIVYVERSGHPPEELWHVNGQPRRVNKKEYARALLKQN